MLTPAELGGLFEGAEDDLVLARAPARISGAEYLARYAGISDRMTSVDSASQYMVRAATLHPIFEHERARSLIAGVSGARDER